MAIVGVVYKVYQIAISIAIGMAAGCIPIIGYNIGAKQYKRVKQLLSKLIIYESLVGLVALLIVEIIPKGYCHYLVRQTKVYTMLNLESKLSEYI